MKNYKTKAEKFTDVFRLISSFNGSGVYLLEKGGKVFDYLKKSEINLWNNLWIENHDIARKNIVDNFVKGNDIKFDVLTKEAFNLAKRVFKDIIADSDNVINYCNHVRVNLDEKLDSILKMEKEFDTFPEYSKIFYNIGKEFNILGFDNVLKIKPDINSEGYIENRVSSIELDLVDDLNIEEGLYIIPELDNFRFDINKSYPSSDCFVLEFDAKSPHADKFIKLIKKYIDDFDNQINSTEEDDRYSVYDVYSINELL